MKKETKSTRKVNEPFDFRSIKTVNDAFKKQKLERPKLKDLLVMVPPRFRAAWLSVYELFVIFEAINDGWKADFTNSSQWKYYPWGKVLSAGSGFDFSDSDFGYGDTDTVVGSRLCTNTSEKAKYIFKQFNEQYKKFFL
jgi:hypothetical protein